jgi:sirohydrochlorin ferrochelatase
MQSAVPRVEDKIRELCAQVLATEDEDELRPMLVELRNALRQHIQHLRRRFANYPFLVERRVRDVILPPLAPASQDAVDETGATTRTDETKPDSKNVSRADESAA